ncbi:MAG: protoglobin domain-containing protein [Kofleriaceae bacterium]
MILEQLISYVQFDTDDQNRLRSLHDRLAPEFPAIANKFYEVLWQNPEAASVLTGPDQVERLRRTLIDWMSTGLLGPWDLEFNQKRARIGQVHVRIGLAQQFMFTAMNVVRVAYLDRIAQLYPAPEALLVMRAVDKLFDIELALMLRHYQIDSEQRLVSRERQIQGDQIAALQTMTAGLAHEVRNPLNAAKLQLELLERRVRRTTEDPKLVDPIGLAHHEIQRLTEMLNEFLAFARPPELNVHDADAVAIVRQVLELERALADRTSTELTLKAPSSAVVPIDSGKVHQIVQNLVRNAIEATPGGHVDIAVALEDAMLHIRVSDDGPGMTPETRARMFEPFFSTKESGTGMGMSIVHSLVNLHGGHIDVATGSAGTSFEISLPRRLR